MNLSLQLTEAQEQELLPLATQFNQELEKQAFPTAATLKNLKEKLSAVLEAQPGFADILQQAKTRAELLCLAHERTAIRNLPWQTATEESSLLAVAKSSKPDLPAHQPSVGYPLKVLIMVAAPEGVTRLAYEEEELQLLRAFSPLMSQGLVQVHFTDDGSLENLEMKLEENKYHILHYSGHGGYHKNEGTLALEDPITGRLKETNAVQFNAVLAKAATMGHRPDLVVLSACQTAQGIEASDLSGVADTLLTGGVPAVIAMSASILDNCATEFAAALYTKLSRELPLAFAFQEARKSVREYEISTFKLAERGFSPGQWLIPQLLLNEQVEVLIDKTSPKEVLDFKNDVKIIRGEQALVDLRVRPKNYVFIGRRKEKRVAFSQLKEGQSILLRGQGGVGKTALAEHLAIRLLAANQRIKVFTFSEKAPTAQSLLDQLKNYLSKDKKDFKIFSELPLITKQTDQFIHLLGRVVAYCDPIFLFDNIESFQVFDPEKGAWIWHAEKHLDVLQVIQILQEQTSFPMIITGRYPIAEFPELEICNMNTVPFSDFFRKCFQLGFSQMAEKLPAKPSTTKRAEEGEKPTFEQIARLLHTTFGGNYRALEFFDELYHQKGADIFQTLKKLSDFEARLNDQQIKEGVLSQISENLIFEELLTYLNDQEKDTLFVLAQYNIPVLPMAVGMQRKEENRLPDLGKLVNLTLVEKQTGIDERDRYYVIPMVKELLLQNKTIHQSFDEKVAGDYHKYVLDQDLEEDGLTELTEAFERYFLAKSVTDINDVGWRLCRFYYDIQQFQLSLSFGLRTEEIAGEKTPGYLWNTIGQIWHLFGHLELALQYLKKSLQYYIERGDRQGEGTTLNNISQIHKVRGDYDAALKFLQQSLKIRQEIGDRQGEGATLNNLATTAHAKGDYDNALHFLQQALKIQQEIGDRQGEGATLNNISQIYHAKGDYDAALKFLQQALKITQEIGDRQGEGPTLSNISQIYHAKGDYDNALHFLQQALKIQQEIGDRKGEGTTLNNIGQIYHAKGEYDNALKFLQQALKIQQEIGDRQGEGTTLNNISQIHKVRGEHDNALHFLQQALKIQQEIGDRQGEGTTLNNLGTTAHAKGEYDNALQFLQQALKIQQEIGDRKGESTTIGNIASIYKARGQFALALEYFQKDLGICQEIGDIPGMAIPLFNMGAMLFKQDKFEEAVPLLWQTYQIFDKIGSPIKKNVASYLNPIIEKIGEARFQEIIQQNP